MSDPLRTDSSRAPADASEADRDAKIEQLLLVGLDHYFAAQYEQAINVWTRALFFDRNHARARAYIERARSAVAERQRQSEELLHGARAAFDRGESAEARRLVEAAIQGGAPVDEARALIDRLDRLDRPVSQRPARASRFVRGGGAATSRVRAAGASVVRVAVIGVLVIAALASVGIAASGRFDWHWLLGGEQPAQGLAAPPLARDAALPLPRQGETALARARALAAGGHLHDAIDTLESVRPTDPQKVEADRLRGELQRQLLGMAATARGTAGRERADGRQP